jgi:hypothetical protein
MFAWYKDSSVCYTYMDDVGNENPRHPDSLFSKSRWFTRGWTLQELIAPKIIVFLSSTWRELGTRADLAQTISTITGIDHELMLPNYRITSLLRNYGIACKMSWAAKRETTRIEDKGYCLMGLFEVNMPLLYGEGDKAFIRLQKEIINAFNDFSIFAWHTALRDAPLRYPGSRGILAPSSGSRGMLALSPRVFETCSDVSPSNHDGQSQSTFEIYKSDIRMQVPTIWIDSPDEHLSLQVRRAVDFKSFDTPRDVRTVLEETASLARRILKIEKPRAFIAILPCKGRYGVIGIALLDGADRPLQRCAQVHFQEFFTALPKLSTFHVPIRDNNLIWSLYSYGPLKKRIATVELARDCFLDASHNITGPQPNSGGIEAPALFTAKCGEVSSLFIKSNSIVELWPVFMVALDCKIDGSVVLANFRAARDTDTIWDAAKATHNAFKSSKYTSEVRTPLIGKYEAVIKFRIHYTSCKVLVGVEGEAD